MKDRAAYVAAWEKVEQSWIDRLNAQPNNSQLRADFAEVLETMPEMVRRLAPGFRVLARYGLCPVKVLGGPSWYDFALRKYQYPKRPAERLYLPHIWHVGLRGHRPTRGDICSYVTVFAAEYDAAEAWSMLPPEQQAQAELELGPVPYF